MSETRRILILMAEAGFGHRSAAQAIAAALNQLYGDQCVVEIFNPLDDERTIGLMRSTQTSYDQFVKQRPDLYRASFEFSDQTVPSAVMDGAYMVTLFDTLRTKLHSFDPDAIVSVYQAYAAPLGAIYALERRHIPLITVITDLVTVHRQWYNKVADAIVVPTQQAYDLGIKYKMAPEKLRLVGIPVSPLFATPPADKRSQRTALGWQPDMITALVAGSERVPNLLETLRALNHSGLQLQLIVVAGGSTTLYEQLRAETWHAAVQLYRFVDNMAEMLLASDFVIGKAGGLITSEALAAGLPLVLIYVIEGQETGNASYVVENGAGDLPQNPLETLETVFHWLDQDGALLAARTAQARQIGRPRAALDIAEIAWQAAAQGPRRLRQGPPQQLLDMLQWFDIDTGSRAP